MDIVHPLQGETTDRLASRSRPRINIQPTPKCIHSPYTRRCWQITALSRLCPSICFLSRSTLAAIPVFDLIRLPIFYARAWLTSPFGFFSFTVATKLLYVNERRVPIIAVPAKGKKQKGYLTIRSVAPLSVSEPFGCSDALPRAAAHI